MTQTPQADLPERRWAWQRIRILRSKPPGLVAHDSEREAIFAAALEQSEQLMQAAAAVTAAARPLPLFYSLSQAGRAVAAVHLEADWQLKSHGLQVPDMPGAPVMERVVCPRPTKDDSFSRVAEAVGSDVLSDETELGALWSALPELMFPFPPIRRWLLPLRVFADIDGYGDVIANLTTVQNESGVMGFPQLHATANEIKQYLQHFPTARKAEAVIIPGTDKVVSSMVPGFGILPRVRWPIGGTKVYQQLFEFDQMAPEYRRAGERYALPQINGKDVLKPIMLWWGLLLGLSSLARYDAAAWVAALDVDESEMAVPLEAALDEALDAVPRLILSALEGRNVLVGEHR